MKKVFIFLLITISFFTLTGCKNKIEDLPDNPIVFSSGVIKYEENGIEFRTISYNNKTYIIYGSIKPKGRFEDTTYAYGECLGYIGNDKNNRVYELKGKSKDEWLIEYYVNDGKEKSIVFKEMNASEKDVLDIINPFDFN